MQVVRAIEAGILMFGCGLAFILLTYWVSSKYRGYKKKMDSYLADEEQDRMQENIVTMVILMALITLAAWFYLVTLR
jgi:hypothetical protein